MKEQIIQQGAEAKIILSDNKIIKNRISKSYRLKELDEKIRKQRTKSEKKLLEKACKIIDAPNPFPLKEFDKIEMPFILGEKLSEHLDSFSLKKQEQICRQIGENIAKLHDAEIIHGDLTTSNMIFVEEPEKNAASQIDKITNKKTKTLSNPHQSASTKSGAKQSISEQSEPVIFFIDFGLGYVSKKFEDKAVDLHLLRQALESRHFENGETLFKEVLKGYSKSKDSKIVLEKLKAVEKRGRYRH